MEGWPTICVALLTYRRTEVALRTVRAMAEHCRYSGSLLYYIADDGSAEDHILALQQLIGELLVASHSQRTGPGPSWNRAVSRIAEVSPLSVWLEDDFELRRPLDLDPYVRLLL